MHSSAWTGGHFGGRLSSCAVVAGVAESLITKRERESKSYGDDILKIN